MTYTDTVIPNGQFFEENYGAGGTFLKAHNGNLYFIVTNVVGYPLYPGANFGLVIFKSTDNGANWTRVIDDAGRVITAPMGVCISGDVIHIVSTGNNSPSSLDLYRFDTLSETMLADQSVNGNDTGLPTSCVALSTGDIFILTTRTTPGYVIWNGASFSSFTAISGTTSSYLPKSCIKEHVRDRVYVFTFESTAGGDTNGNIWCAVVDPLGAGQISQTKIFSNVGHTVNGRTGVGWPAINDDDSQIILPFKLDTNDLHVMRADTATLTWVEETIDTTAIVGAGNTPATFSAWNWDVPAGVSQGTGFAVAFGVQNTLTGANARAWLYQSNTTSSSGGWSAPAIILTGAAPSSIGSNYPTELSSTSYGLITATFDPVLFSTGSTKYSSLTMWYVNVSLSPTIPNPLGPDNIQYVTLDGTAPGGSTPIIISGPPTGNIADFILKGINIYGVRMYPERPNNLQRF